MFEEKEIHFAAAGTTKRVNREGSKKRKPPTGKRAKKRALGRMNGRDKASELDRRRKRNARVIDAVVANHLEMLIRDMNN